jgi:tetratricopeptide (TPR) repeat protein
MTLERVAVEVLNLMALGYSTYCEDHHTGCRYIDIAQKIEPRNWILHSNKAHMLNTALRYEDAKTEVLKAVEACDVEAHDPYYNCGVILGNLMELDQAIKMYRLALTKKNIPLIAHNLGSTLLMNGEFEEGWKFYEERFGSFDNLKKIKERFEKPHWDGKASLRRKTLYIYNEQGVGDLFQFVRFLPALAKKGAQIIIEVQRETQSLIEANKKKLGIAEVVGRDGLNWPKLPEYDYALSICSVPGIFNAHPGNVPKKAYIKPPDRPPEAWPKDKLKVGICWAGSTAHKNDHARSCHLNRFRPLAELPHVQLYSLQKGPMHHRKWPTGWVNLYDDVQTFPFIDLGPSINNFEDTAHYINNLDLVLSIDTAVVHLAGAMGKPVWTLVPYVPDWRWLKTGEKTAWYPSMKLLRQKQQHGWDQLFLETYNLLAATPSPSGRS